MVTTFNKTDLVRFGNFLMEEIASGKKEKQPYEDYKVTYADIQNWMVDRQISAVDFFKKLNVNDVPEDKKEAFIQLKPLLDNLISESIVGPDGTF